MPAAETARRALSDALFAWQSGQPTGKIGTTTPTVVVVDSHRRTNQTLQKYEILSGVMGDNYRAFSVRLSLANPAEQTIARYNVFGLDPIWVFRQEDYDMLSHWEHHMTDPKNEDQTPTPARQ